MQVELEQGQADGGSLGNAPGCLVPTGLKRAMLAGSVQLTAVVARTQVAMCTATLLHPGLGAAACLVNLHYPILGDPHYPIQAQLYLLSPHYVCAAAGSSSCLACPYVAGPRLSLPGEA